MVDYGSDVLSFMQDGYLEAIFGDLEKAKKSDVSIEWLIKQNAKNKKTDQKLYLACGEADGLMNHSKKICADLKKNGYDVTFETGPGAHEWDFWNRYIKHVIDWLPLDEQAGGLNSGNIGDR
jgi:S-formylglutathione hydrolase FrmB